MIKDLQRPDTLLKTRYRSYLATRDSLGMIEEVGYNGNIGARLSTITYDGIGDRFISYEEAAKDRAFVLFILDDLAGIHLNLQEASQARFLSPREAFDIHHKVESFPNLSQAFAAFCERVEDCDHDRGILK